MGEVVGGMIASAVGDQISKKLGEFLSEEISLLWGFKDDVEGLQEKMEDLQAVLRDADDSLRRGERNGEAVGRWLIKFKSVAHDVEDVLDELDANKLINKTHSKLKLFFSRDNQLLQRMNIAHNMKNVRQQIGKITKEGQELNLARPGARAEGSRNNETIAAISDESIGTEMVGRVTEKEKIIRLVLTSEATDDISIIPIVGLGGLGKTTLARSVFADKLVNVFDVQAWVYVSEKFDLHKIGSAIMRSINPSVNFEGCNLQFLIENLEKGLSGRRYLIVLDDLWEEDGDELERLKQMLQHGCRGSRIIVTTRTQSVVKKLYTGFLANKRKICPVPETDQINLDDLSADDCWELMKRRAFGPHDDQSGLEDIGRQIAKKCGGLPLVANALGQVMSELKTVHAWEEIRDTKIDLGSLDQKGILERLMLSYYFMKLDFKMCFTYLVVFPKGFVIGSNRLIQQWIALGYIHTENNGHRCINYLMGMSFLQISSSSSVSSSTMHANESPEFTMHDLAHDLASEIIANEFLVLDATEPRSWRKDCCRHAQLIKWQNESKVFKDLPRKVRSLHFRYSGKLHLPRDAFSRSKYIRVLDLSGCSIEGQSTPNNIVLPSSIHQLKLLRYLDATGLPIKSLPKSFHQLQNMETLILCSCSLETLTDNIGSLHKLCYLDLSDNSTLSKLPSSLGNLSILTFLNLSGCSTLEELPESFCKLTCLWHLDMSECCALKSLPDKFGNLQNLGFLNLSDCYKLSILPESFGELKHLKDLFLVDCHDLTKLPECFGDLSELESLNLTSCCKLRLLPESLCNLSKLRHLNLSYCITLDELPSSLGDLKLQILEISCNIGLCSLPDSMTKMTSLTQLVAISLSLPLFLRAQEIRQDLNLLFGRTIHSVHEMDNGGRSSIVQLAQVTCQCHELIVENLENVSHLEDAERAKLRDKSGLKELCYHWGARTVAEKDKSVLEKLAPPRTLGHFILCGYTSKDFPNWMLHISSYLPSVTSITLTDLGTCDALPPFGQLPNLRHLCLGSIPNIKIIDNGFYGDGGICRKLRYLQLVSMENLVEWWTTQSGEEQGKFLIPNLHGLDCQNCPKLKFLPYPPRSITWTLKNSNEVLPERGFGRLQSSTLPCRMEIGNCSFSPEQWNRFQHLPTLEKFSVICYSGLRFLPEAIRFFTSLRELYLVWLDDLEILPEWLGQLSCLEVLFIHSCPKLTSLPESIRDLTALKRLLILYCPTLLRRCREEDADKTSHIPTFEYLDTPTDAESQAKWEFIEERVRRVGIPQVKQNEDISA